MPAKKQIAIAHLQQRFDVAARHDPLGNNIFRNLYIAEQIESLPEQAR